MQKLLTAEEFLNVKGITGIQANTISIWMIEFAKLHAQSALENAAEKSNLLLTDKKGNTKTTGGYDAYGSVATVNKQSILNAYPLENIK